MKVSLTCMGHRLPISDLFFAILTSHRTNCKAKSTTLSVVKGEETPIILPERVIILGRRPLLSRMRARSVPGNVARPYRRTYSPDTNVSFVKFII